MKINANRTLLARQTVSVGETVSSPMYIAEATGVSFQVTWEGSPVATIRLQTSNDPRCDKTPETATWFTEDVTISGCSGAVANGSIVEHFNNFNSGYARIKLSVTTAGTISIYGTAKE